MEWTDYQSSSRSDARYEVVEQESILDPLGQNMKWVVYTPKAVPLRVVHDTRDEAKKAAQDHFDLSSNLF